MRMAGIGVTRVTDCPVCFGTFEDPRVLPCGHTFCLGCITEHGRSKDSDPDCPNCRTKFQIPSNGFESLPKNYSLNSVLYESASTVRASKAKVTKGLCKKHSGEELVLYCVQCNVVICLDCLEDDHKTHDYSKINRFAKEARSQLEGFMKNIKPILSQVTCQKSEVEDESNKFRDLLGKTELAINEKCEKIIQLVNNHRLLLLEELSNEKQKLTKDLKMRMDEIETEQLRLKSFNTRIEEMLKGRDEATSFDIVCHYKDFKNSFDKLKQTQPQAMGQVRVPWIEFIPDDFKDFVSRRGNIIGRLHKESNYFISGRNNNQAQTRSADNFSLAQASAADRVEPMTFKTPSGLTVYVAKGNLVNQSLDAIVNPANENLSNEGGAARAIAKAAGDTLQRECNEYIRKEGKLGITHVMHTSAGNLKPKIKYVIHTVGPTKDDVKDDEELFALVRLTVFNCINYTNEHLKIRSLAIPAISSGIFGVPIEIVGRASFEALKMFDDYYASCKKKNLREIHFLNKDEPTFSRMKRIFQSMMSHESSVDPEQPVHANWATSGQSHDMNNRLSHANKKDHSFEALIKDEARDKPPEEASGMAWKKDNKEKTSDEAGKKAAKAEDDKKDDDDNHCIICMDNITDKKELSCKHKFCRGCIDDYFTKGQPKCPSCGKVFVTVRGNQPEGTMATKENSWQLLPGFNDCGAIEIEYYFNNGIQGDNHPNPGQPYRGRHQMAYLPANREGREVLRLLKRAFDAGLVFTIGLCNTTGRDNVVIWNDIHHKTSLTGRFGYPDPTYLKRVKEELAAKGIQ